MTSPMSWKGGGPCNFFKWFPSVGVLWLAVGTTMASARSVSCERRHCFSPGRARPTPPHPCCEGLVPPEWDWMTGRSGVWLRGAPAPGLLQTPTPWLSCSCGISLKPSRPLASAHQYT